MEADKLTLSSFMLFLMRSVLVCVCLFLSDEDMQSLASLMSVKPADIGNLDDFNESDEEEDKKSVSATGELSSASSHPTFTHLFPLTLPFPFPLLSPSPSSASLSSGCCSRSSHSNSPESPGSSSARQEKLHRTLFIILR